MTDTPMTAEEKARDEIALLCYRIRSGGDLEVSPGLVHFMADMLDRKAPDDLRQAVKVKALEWKEPSQLTNGCWVADAPFIGYSICHEDCRFHVICEGWNISGDDQDVGLDCPTLEAAQTAAQAHYEKVIREALEPCASDSAVSEPAPDDMVMVPWVPTEAMLKAGQECGRGAPVGFVYRAMLSAAPTGET